MNQPKTMALQLSTSQDWKCSFKNIFNDRISTLSFASLTCMASTRKGNNTARELSSLTLTLRRKILIYFETSSVNKRSHLLSASRLQKSNPRIRPNVKNTWNDQSLPLCSLNPPSAHPRSKLNLLGCSLKKICQI
jgi:hypothetical protein